MKNYVRYHRCNCSAHRYRCLLRIPDRSRIQEMKKLIVCGLLALCGVSSAQFARFDSCTGRPTFIVGQKTVRSSAPRIQEFRPSVARKNHLDVVRIRVPKKQEFQGVPCDKFVNPRWL